MAPFTAFQRSSGGAFTTDPVAGARRAVLFVAPAASAITAFVVTLPARSATLIS